MRARMRWVAGSRTHLCRATQAQHSTLYNGGQPPRVLSSLTTLDSLYFIRHGFGWPSYVSPFDCLQLLHPNHVLYRDVFRLCRVLYFTPEGLPVLSSSC